MAELATIARPYAEALFQVARGGHAQAIAAQLDAVASAAADTQLRTFADHPKAGPEQVLEVIVDVVKTPLDAPVRNLLATVIDNGRLAALPEIAQQFRALVNASSGVSQATVFSAFPMDEAQVAGVLGALEKRFGRKLDARVEVEPALIGGIRVVVGDEVLDTSVKARLEQMKVALSA